MTTIYGQFDKAFGNVSAFAIFKGDKPVGRVCFKYPKDGAGRLWCYVHVWGAPMVRGYAGGYGYDKASAAFVAAASRIKNFNEVPADVECEVLLAHVCNVKDNGHGWKNQLQDLGYTVQHVIDG